MARWHLTSKRSSHQIATMIGENAGLDIYATTQDKTHFLVTFLKRVSKASNFIQKSETEWICSAGTILYDGHIGEKALERFYQKVARRGIAAARNTAIGHYAVAIRQGPEIWLFTDPLGSYRLYYSQSEDGWQASNSLQMIAANLDNPSIDPVRLLSHVFHGGAMSHQTFYEDVYRLDGKSVIKVNLDDKNIITKDVVKVQPTPSTLGKKYDLDESLERVINANKRIFGQLGEVNDVGLFMTGGLDSRTVLAAALNQGIEPTLMYGSSNNNLMISNPADRGIAKDISDSFGLRFLDLDYSGDQPHSDEKLQTLFDSYGFKYDESGAPDGMIGAFEGGIPKYPKIIINGDSPVFTNLKPWESPVCNWRVDDLVERLKSYAMVSMNFKCSNQYEEYIRNSIREAVDPKWGFVRAFCHFNIRAHARVLNYMNEFTHFLVPYQTYALYNAMLQVPDELRANDSFQLQLIHRLSPGLIRFDVHSGNRSARIDAEQWQLEYRTGIEKRSLIHQIKTLLPAQFAAYVRALRRQVVQVWQQLGSGSEGSAPHEPVKVSADDRIREQYSQKINAHPVLSDHTNSLSNIFVYGVARIWHYLIAIDRVKTYRE